MPGNGEPSAQIDRAVQKLGPARVAVQQELQRTLGARRLQHGDHLGVGLARVDHQRQPCPARGFDVELEHGALNVARAVVVMEVQPALADRHTWGCEASAAKRSTVRSVKSRASCGCTPAVAQTSGCDWEISRTAGSRSGRSQMVSIRPTPAARARAITASRSPAKAEREG